MRLHLTLCAVLLAVAAAICYAGWLLGGKAGLSVSAVLSSPLIAMAAAPLLAALLGRTYSAARQIAYRDVQGRYFEYKGRSLQVHEDLAGERWLRAADIRKVVVNLPRDQVLVRIAAAGVGQVEAKGALFFSAQALDRFLERSHDEATIRFRHWLQREVIFPARHAAN